MSYPTFNQIPACCYECWKGRCGPLKCMIVKLLEICYLSGTMRNILLINPWIYDFAAYDCWNKPIGLLYLASFLRMNGANVYFLDCSWSLSSRYAAGSLTAIPKRKISGEGGYPKERIPKPIRLDISPRNYNRYGIKPETFISISSQYLHLTLSWSLRWWLTGTPPSSTLSV